MTNKLDGLRGSVRPVLTYVFSLAIIGLASYLVIKYGDQMMARDFATVMIGSGTLLLGLYAGSRLREPPRGGTP